MLSATAFSCASSAGLSVRSSTVCAALGDLFEGLNGPGWVDTSGWADAAAGRGGDYCSFFGVTCAPGTGDVTNVSLGYNGLVGTLPESLGALSALQGLAEARAGGGGGACAGRCAVA